MLVMVMWIHIFLKPVISLYSALLNGLTDIVMNWAIVLCLSSFLLLIILHSLIWQIAKFPILLFFSSVIWKIILILINEN